MMKTESLLRRLCAAESEMSPLPFQIIRQDITKVKADAVVNTANPRPLIGSGTDTAIYQAAGMEQLLAERRKIGIIPPGQVRATPAFALDARYILHTVGPVWIDGHHGERDILRSCYQNTLNAACELGCKSVAFPLISSGAYRFPKEIALHIALSEIGEFLLTHEMKVTLVVFDRQSVALSAELVDGIEEFIDERRTQCLQQEEYKSIGGRLAGQRREAEREYAALPMPEKAASFCGEPVPPPCTAKALPASAGKSLDDLLNEQSDTFQQKLFKLIDERGLSDVAVYKKANIDRKVFSRIRCKANYKPKKKTAVAFAIALELDMPAMTDLLSRAEIALSPSSKFDLIIEYFVSRKIYDIYEINAALFKYGQPILGE